MENHAVEIMRFPRLAPKPPRHIAELRDALVREMNDPPKEIEWDLPGFFPARAFVLLAGRRGDGKSYFLQAYSKAAAHTGELIKGLPVTRKRILYVTREGGPEFYDHRFSELQFDFRTSRDFVLWGPWMERKPPFIIGDPDDDQAYRDWAEGFVPCTIAFDGLRRFSRPTKIHPPS